MGTSVQIGQSLQWNYDEKSMQSQKKTLNLRVFLGIHKKYHI